jgi:hypothetical protein
MSNGGMQDPYKNVDPNGLQTGSTASTAIGLGLIAASEGGSTVASALGLGAASAKLATAGFSLVALGNVSLFAAGLALVGLGIILNVISLVIRRQYAREAAAAYRTSHDSYPPTPPAGPRMG